MCSLFLVEEKGKPLMGVSVLNLLFKGCISCLMALTGGESREGWHNWKDKDNY